MSVQSARIYQPHLLKGQVLVVEDDRRSRVALVSLLIARGYDVTGTESAEAAMQIIAAGGAPTVALVDYNLPGMNGLELARHLQRTYPAIMPVLITAQSRQSIPMDGRPVAYLQKPIDVRKLLILMASAR